jgi:phosphoketolase
MKGSVVDDPLRSPALAADDLRRIAPTHVKSRLLGHWSTTPGLNLMYAHLNRAIVQRDLK